MSSPLPAYSQKVQEQLDLTKARSAVAASSSTFQPSRIIAGPIAATAAATVRRTDSQFPPGFGSPQIDSLLYDAQRKAGMKTEAPAKPIPKPPPKIPLQLALSIHPLPVPGALVKAPAELTSC